MATLADYQTTALANANYSTANDRTKAAAFIEAVRAMLILHVSGTHDGATVNINPDVWRGLLAEAEAWYQASGGAAGFTVHSFEDFR